MDGDLHVVFLDHVARLSGAEIHLRRLIEGLKGVADGFRATVLLAENGPLVEALLDAGAQVEVIPLEERARSLKRTDVRVGRAQARAAVDVTRYVRRVQRRLIELQPDIVGAISLKAGIYGAAAARLAQVPLIWHLHDQISANYLARQAVIPVRLIIGTLPTAVIAPSKAVLDIVRWFRPGLTTGVIPHPIPMPPSPATIRPEVHRVGIVGRLAPWKGQDVFLRAFARAFPDNGVRAVLIGNAMFGEGDYERELRLLSEELGISDRVDFLGFRQDVPAELQQIDLLVHASQFEPGGLAVSEGMAAGLPVIASRSGGPAEYIAHGQTGLLHTPGDVDELAHLMELARDFELRVRLASAGRELARKFEPAKVAQAWLRTYREILGRADSDSTPIEQAAT
jgi:glycosyltransferase involved in cell wall biosynthesis